MDISFVRLLLFNFYGYALELAFVFVGWFVFFLALLSPIASGPLLYTPCTRFFSMIFLFTYKKKKDIFELIRLRWCLFCFYLMLNITFFELNTE